MEYANANKGIALVQEGKHAEAVPLLTEAIAVTKSPIWLLARADAHTHLGQYEHALSDAEHAYVIASGRQGPQRLNHMIEAQHRRGVALFRMGRWADADACLLWAVRLSVGASPAEKDPALEKVDADGFYRATLQDLASEKPEKPANDDAGQPDLSQNSKWVRSHSMRHMCLANLEKLPADSPQRKLTVTRTPTPSRLVKGEYNPEGRQPPKAKSKAKSQAAGSSSSSSSAVAAAAAAAAPVGTTQPRPENLRVDFFQSASNATISIFCKGVDKAKFRAEARDGRTVVLHNIPQEGDPPVVLKLCHDMDPAKMKQTVGSTKVELALAKAQPGEKWKTWGSLSSSSPDAAAAEPGPDKADAGESSPESDERKPEPEPIPRHVLLQQQDRPPAYPTSSKSGPKDWDHLDVADEDEPENLNNFFEKLYKGASPDARRAMMKSFTESNGTELSMDWNDVGQRQVPVHPPEGVDVRSWDGA